MQKTTKFLLLAFAITGSQSLSAEVLLEEGFSGIADGTSLNGLNSWSASSKYDVIDYTWGSWTNYSTIADKAIRADSGSGPGEASKDLTRAITAGSNETIYMSFTFNGDDTNAGWFNFMLRNGSGSSTTASDVNNAFGQYSGNDFNIGSADFGSSTDTDRSGDFLVITSMTFGSGAGGAVGGLSVFAPGEDVSVVYSAFEQSATSEISGTMTEWRGRINDFTTVGNIRVGTSLAEVGVVPEPSSYALLAGFVALGAMTLRRRR